MEIGEVLENKMPKAIEYASHIIMETDSFIEFAVALVDYMEEDFIPYCKLLFSANPRKYSSISNCSFLFSLL